MRKLAVLIFWLSMGAGCHKDIDPDCVEKVPVSGCGCGYVLQPVCGCNGKTYANPCLAECAGIKKYQQGKCGN